MRDKETIEIALEAAETGHLVLSTLHTIDASKTVERIIGAFPMGEQQIIRNRLGKSFRAIVSQRLIPRKDGNGRVAIVEILKSTLRTREYIEKGEQDGKTLLEAMTDGDTDGMQHFDGEIEKLVRAGVVDLTTGSPTRPIPGTSARAVGPVLSLRRVAPPRKPRIMWSGTLARCSLPRQGSGQECPLHTSLPRQRRSQLRLHLGHSSSRMLK